MTVFIAQLKSESQVGYPRVRSLGTGYSFFSFATFSFNISFSFDDGFYWTDHDLLLDCFCR